MKRRRKPTPRRPTPKRPSLIGKIPEELTKTSCPHCTSQIGWRRRIASCCQCGGEHRISLTALSKVMSSVWERQGCICDACICIAQTSDAQKSPQPLIKFERKKAA